MFNKHPGVFDGRERTCNARIDTATKRKHKVTLHSIWGWRCGIMPFMASSKDVKISLKPRMKDGEVEKQVASALSINWKWNRRDHTQSDSLSTHTPSSPSAQLAYFVKPNRWLYLLNDKGIKGCEEVAGMGAVKAIQQSSVLLFLNVGVPYVGSSGRQLPCTQGNCVPYLH